MAIRLPTTRAARAWLYQYCAQRAGVRPVYQGGRLVGFTAPNRLDVYTYLERMRELAAPLAAPPAPIPMRRGARRRGKRS